MYNDVHIHQIILQTLYIVFIYIYIYIYLFMFYMFQPCYMPNFTQQFCSAMSLISGRESCPRPHRGGGRRPGGNETKKYK